MKGNNSPLKAVQSGLSALNLGPADLPEQSIQPFASGLFQTYRVELPEQTLLAKVIHPFAIAEAELDGLCTLRDSGAEVPVQFGLFHMHNSGVLFMELVQPGKPDPSQFLQGLYAPVKSWGYHRDNFIGSLPQPNKQYATFRSFWWESRIEPQLRRALSRGFLDNSDARTAEAVVLRCCDAWMLDQSQPRLVHGDLWNGNLLFNKAGQSVLIDPAAAWSHPEQDLAMLELFGSPVPARTLNAAADRLGLEPGRGERVPFFQLYPLLVHVNLFGAGYVSAVRRVLSQYA